MGRGLEWGLEYWAARQLLSDVSRHEGFWERQAPEPLGAVRVQSPALRISCPSLHRAVGRKAGSISADSMLLISAHPPITVSAAQVNPRNPFQGAGGNMVTAREQRGEVLDWPAL